MSSKQQLPLEVSTWMNKGLTLRKVTANSRLLTNDTRQNIVLSRQFFSDILTLSFARYRTAAEHDCEKKMFLRHQRKKAESSMPGLLPYVDRLTYDINRPTTGRIQSSRKGDNSFISPSTQSFLSRPGTKSESAFQRRRQSSTRQIQTAQVMNSRPVVTPMENSTPATDQRPATTRYMSRERLNRLAQPKGYRAKTATIGREHVRANINEGPATTAEDVFGVIAQELAVVSPPTQNTLSEKRKNVIHDQRFDQLMSAFSARYVPETSNLQTFKSIVAANTSLQDNEGQWKMENPSVPNRKAELKYHREMLAKKLNNKIDIFLIDIGA